MENELGGYDRNDWVGITEICKLSVKNEISSIVVEPEFIYFVMDGFKGVNYGLVFSSLSKDRLNGFHEVQFIRRWDSSHYWYFASSKYY